MGVRLAALVEAQKDIEIQSPLQGNKREQIEKVLNKGALLRYKERNKQNIKKGAKNTISFSK